jgi:hypothetical protein
VIIDSGDRTVYLVFVNEVADYEQGRAMVLTEGVTRASELSKKSIKFHISLIFTWHHHIFYGMTRFNLYLLIALGDFD